MAQLEILLYLSSCEVFVGNYSQEINVSDCPTSYVSVPVELFSGYDFCLGSNFEVACAASRYAGRGMHQDFDLCILYLVLHFVLKGRVLCTPTEN